MLVGSLKVSAETKGKESDLGKVRGMICLSERKSTNSKPKAGACLTAASDRACHMACLRKY